MSLHKSATALHGFSEAKLLELIGVDGAPTRYLGDYLKELGAATILVEQHYVDRHFVDDFASYYARSFHPPSPHCKRLHFFRHLNVPDLQSKLVEAYRSIGDRDRASTALTDQYLGFVVRRDLESAPVGRTVLRTYESDSGRRRFPVTRDYHVNVAGIRLSIRGLAYQQQDRGAAVCASTAIWSALQKVAHQDGQRTPTPSAVTRAAQSPYPASHGLGPNQMATALSGLGYIADLFVPNSPVLFKAKLTACLDSGLPVVLLLGGAESGSEGHAVTVTGYSFEPRVVEVPMGQSISVRMLGTSSDTLYVHDDNLGSHAHYELFLAAREAGKPPRQMIRRNRSSPPSPSWWPTSELEVIGALVPKPAKLRMPIEDLFASVLGLRRALERVLPKLELSFRTRFATGVAYREELFDLSLHQDHFADFQQTITLPRYVGVVSVAGADERHLLDVIIDVSAIDTPVLAIVCPGVPFLTPAHSNISRLATAFQGCPIITGPEAAVQTDI